MRGAPIIEKIELTLFEIRLADLTTDAAGFGIAYAPGTVGAHARFAVRIFTDDGVVGEYVPPRGRAKVIMSAVEALAHSLIGKPALQRERHYAAMRRLTKHIGEVGIGALDIALWDLAGKFHGASIATLLGGYRERLPAYASTMHGDDKPSGLSSPGAYADFAERCLEMGYGGYKMHGWSGDVAAESAMIRAVGERVGGRMNIMYDAASHMATLGDAIKIGRVCDEFDLTWLEDPYADGGISIHGHKMLKQNIKTPILITEFVHNLESTTDIMVAGATDFGRADPDYDGGITGCHKVAAAAEGLGMDVEIHSCGPAMRHLMAACRNANFYEVNLVHPGCGNAWSLPVYADGYSDQLDCIGADGCVGVPDGPGLGVAYDWDAIKRAEIGRCVIG